MFDDALPFALSYVKELAAELQAKDSFLKKCQVLWLSFCLTGLFLTNSLNWTAFSRASAGARKAAALSFMFRKSALPWDKLLSASTRMLLRRHNLTQGVLVLDDTDHRRAKTTSRIHGAHRVFDKKTRGFFNGQCLMCAMLVTPRVTLPVGMAFYVPDPARQAWKKEDARLAKAGVPARERPCAPPADPKYPSKAEIALTLINEFHQNHPDFSVNAVLADAAFGTADFMERACLNAGCAQAISQVKGSQLVTVEGLEQTIASYFEQHPGVLTEVTVRGGEVREMWVSSAHLDVKAHGKKRALIAVRNKDEVGYRYLVATDLTWRTKDITQCYTLRWLVETFFEDWKLHEGWANLAKQPDVEGSVRGVTLSLLLDHALLVHPEQLASLETRGAALTVRSLKQATTLDAFVQSVRRLLSAADPQGALDHLVKSVKALFPLTTSSKHMHGRSLGRQAPAPAPGTDNPCRNSGSGLSLA